MTTVFIFFGINKVSTYLYFRHFSIVSEDADILCWEDGGLISVVGMMTDNSGGS